MDRDSEKEMADAYVPDAESPMPSPARPGNVLSDTPNEVRISVNQRFKEAVNFLLRNKLAHNKNEIMSSLGLYLGRLSLILGDKANASTDNLAKLCAKYGVSAQWLLLGTGSMMLSGGAPRYDPAQEARPSDQLPLIPVRGMAKFSPSRLPADTPRYLVPEFSRAGAEFVVRNSGNSMSPTFNNGDLLACRRVATADWIEFGEAYLIDGEQGAMVKRLYADPDDLQGSFQCRSDNETMPPFSVPRASVKGLAKVLGIIRPA